MMLGRLALASVLLVAACDLRPEDFARSRAAVASFQSTWTDRIGQLQQRQASLVQRTQDLPADTVGLDEVRGLLADAGKRLDALAPTVGAVADTAGADLDAGHRRLAADALASADARLRSDVATVAAKLDDAAARVDAVVNAAAAAKAAAAAAAPPAAAIPITTPGFATARNTADLPIGFAAGTADVDVVTPASKAALDALVAFAGSCDELQFALVGHTAKDGDAAVNQRLSGAQAQAVYNYLVAANVSPGKVSQVQGVGGSQPLVPEPEAGSPEEAAMPVDQLAAIRAQNRRIGVLVISPCPA